MSMIPSIAFAAAAVACWYQVATKRCCPDPDCSEHAHGCRRWRAWIHLAIALTGVTLFLLVAGK